MISEKIRNARGSCSMPLLAASPPDPEVLEKAVRRHYTAEFKLSILRQAETCRDERDIGALLRKEGLYSG